MAATPIEEITTPPAKLASGEKHIRFFSFYDFVWIFIRYGLLHRRLRCYVIPACFWRETISMDAR